MIQIATGTQMRQADKAAIQGWGIPGMTLMETAGRALAAEVEKSAEKSFGKEVLILCGAGNNGGDGYVAARLLAGGGIPVKVFALSDPEKLSGDAAESWRRFEGAGGRADLIRDAKDLKRLENGLALADIVVDALLGTGITRPVEGLMKEGIQMVNLWRRDPFSHRRKLVISADIPSGVCADDGAVMGCAVEADRTVTFQRMKVGMMVEPGRFHAGLVRVADIGIPEEICRDAASDFFQLEMADAAEMLPKRPRTMNKGDAGKLLLIAGSPGMAGAAVLSARAALRAGAGLVKVCGALEVVRVVQVAVPEATCLILGEDVHTNCETVVREAELFDAVACGPGLGRSQETESLVKHILARVSRPVVLDADGINVIGQRPEILKKASCPLVLTPHPGEMGRLIGKSAKEVNEERIGIAKSFSSEYNVTLILKGADSLIASPEGRMYINGTGNPGMAAAGSGDVLTGIVGAFLAGGKTPQQAACLGAYIHGLAGDEQEKAMGEYGMVASDIARGVAQAIRLVLAGSEASGRHRPV